MKIEPSTLPNQCKLAIREEASGFEALLHIDKHTCDERDNDAYYWQHQNQLQQSALTFNPINNQLKSTMPPGKGGVNAPLAVLPIDKTHALAISPNVSFKQDARESTLSSQIPIETRCPHLEKILIQHDIFSELHPSFQSASQKNALLKPLTTHASVVNTTYKNYQLFLDDSRAELTLNTVQLSHQQTLDLQKAIKRWLRDKGYSLKQLIINGVQQ